MKTKKIMSAVMVIMMVFALMSPVASAVYFDASELTSGSYLTGKTDYAVAPGITEAYFTTNNADGSNQTQCYALEVDLNNETTSIIASYKNYDAASWGMQKVRDQAYSVESKLGVNVVAGVNGDFYNMTTGAPTGTFVMNGVTYTKNNSWNYFAILNDGTPVIGSGKLDTSNVRECIGGPAVILKDGKLTEDAKTSGYGLSQLPRTAVGITADGKVVFIVSDGRQSPSSCGQTFIQLAETMLAMGCVDALSLDGGGSATFVTQRAGEEELVCRSTSADGSERTVSSSILICSSAPQKEIDNMTIDEPEEHDYYYSSNKLTCDICNDTIIGCAGYTGFATDSASGALMFFINGKPVTGWYAMDEDNYYFDENGLAQTGTITLNGISYTFGNDYKLTHGALIKSGTYTYYYINGEKQRGWHIIDGYWHYFDRQTGFGMATKENSDKVSVDLDKTDGMYTISSTDEVLLYTFNSKGQLIKGSWLTDDFGTAYYWGPNPVSGLCEVDNELYFFDPSANCYMVTNASVQVDGTVYAFDSEGKFVHYSDHTDTDENGKCDICETKNPIADFIEKLTVFVTNVRSFFSELFQ